MAMVSAGPGAGEEKAEVDTSINMDDVPSIEHDNSIDGHVLVDFKQGRKINKKFLLLIAFNAFALSLLTSLMAPFYPEYAKHRYGATTIEVGFVFAGEPLGLVLLSPLTNIIAPRVGRIRLWCAGLLVLGLANLGFVWGDTIYEHMLCNFVKGGAMAFILISIQAIIMECSDHVTRDLGYFEGLVGMGEILGPVFGGALFTVIGFNWTFTVFALMSLGCFVFTATMAYFYHPTSAHRQTHIETTSPPLWKLLTNLFVGTPLFANVVMSLCWSVLDLIGERHFEIALECNVLFNGILLSIPGVTYTIFSSTILSGIITLIGRRRCVLLGLTVLSLSFLLLGPTPVPPFDIKVNSEVDGWLLILVPLMGVGFAASCVNVPALSLLYDGLLNDGFQDENAGVLSASLYATFDSIGDASGPILGGVLMDFVKKTPEQNADRHLYMTGFAYTTTAFSFLVLFCLGVLFTLFMIERRVEKRIKAERMTRIASWR